MLVAHLPHLQTQLARARSARDDAKSAHDLLDRVDLQAEGHLAVQVWSMIERGRALRKEGAEAEAIGRFEAAASRAEEAGLTRLAEEATRLLALPHEELGDEDADSESPL